MTADDPKPVEDAFGAAVRKSNLGNVAGDEAPSGRAILAAIGGIRGLIESILPSFVFLVVFLITQDVVLSTLVPVGVALVFIVARMGARSPVTPAVTGAVGVGITALLAIITNRAENNFVPGILLNTVFLAAMLVSLIARRPIIGLVVAALLGAEAANWRNEPKRFRILTLATWLWVGLFAVRLIVEVPLYLAANAAGLGVAKLILGVPLYALVLWLTWVLVRTVYPPKSTPLDDEKVS
jgi:hypothetical protein